MSSRKPVMKAVEEARSQADRAVLEINERANHGLGMIAEVVRSNARRPRVKTNNVRSPNVAGQENHLRQRNNENLPQNNNNNRSNGVAPKPNERKRPSDDSQDDSEPEKRRSLGESAEITNLKKLKVLELKKLYQELKLPTAQATNFKKQDYLDALTEYYRSKKQASSSEPSTTTTTTTTTSNTVMVQPVVTREDVVPRTNIVSNHELNLPQPSTSNSVTVKNEVQPTVSPSNGSVKHLAKLFNSGSGKGTHEEDVVVPRANIVANHESNKPTSNSATVKNEVQPTVSPSSGSVKHLAKLFNSGGGKGGNAQVPSKTQPKKLAPALVSQDPILPAPTVQPRSEQEVVSPPSSVVVPDVAPVTAPVSVNASNMMPPPTMTRSALQPRVVSPLFDFADNKEADSPQDVSRCISEFDSDSDDPDSQQDDEFVPEWSTHSRILEQVRRQQADPARFNVEVMFGEIPTPDLNSMFGRKPRRPRGSSAVWNSDENNSASREETSHLPQIEEGQSEFMDTSSQLQMSRRDSLRHLTSEIRHHRSRANVVAFLSKVQNPHSVPRPDLSYSMVREDLQAVRELLLTLGFKEMNGTFIPSPAPDIEALTNVILLLR